MASHLPAIPAKRYFTIGEVADLCEVKPHVLRYWEQEFTQLKPMKRRGNRRYYQHHEVLLYEQGFTISGARNRLRETGLAGRSTANEAALGIAAESEQAALQSQLLEEVLASKPLGAVPALCMQGVKEELLQIKALLSL